VSGHAHASSPISDRLQLTIRRNSIGHEEIWPLEGLVDGHGDGLLRLFKRKAFGDGGGDFLAEILKAKGSFLKGVLIGNGSVARYDLWCEKGPDK
jgi:hypothetical protein